LCKKIVLLTPNYEEIKTLLPVYSEMEAAKMLSQYCAVLVKGGHRKDDKKGTDVLFLDNETCEFKGEFNEAYKKHGSGCVFSSAILSNLAQGYPLSEACFQAKNYIVKFLKSNHSLLGYHSNG
jgi:hydroxymethylpyrimidine/phosphomethylpyrimidine kinase